MTITMPTDEVVKRLSAALTERSLRQPYDPESNPVGDRTLTDLLHGVGVLTSADQHPALDMTVKGGYEMERVRKAGLEAGRIDRSAKRMQANRARAERKAQFDAIAASPVTPDRGRLEQAWAVVLPLTPIIARGALAKQAWASRYLGSLADDLPNAVIEHTVLVLAKSDKDLDLLARAARELGDQMERTGKMPGEQMTDEQRKDKKALMKARKWLMGLVNNRLMGALVDAYTSQRNLRWDNIDLIATVMANINGPDDDAYINRHKADRAPAFLGTKFPAPGRIDGNLLATAIGGAITAHRLDALVELLLDEECVRTDGAFSWAENAERVFLLSPQGGAQAWATVCGATEHLANPRRARADAARAHVRNLFEWLPSLVAQVIESFDFEQVAHFTHCKRQSSIMASPFEGRVKGQVVKARPALTYATPADAARAISEHLAVLVTGEEIVSSVVFS